MSPTYDYQQEPLMKNAVSVTFIGPDETRRRALAQAFEKQGASIVGELKAYPNFMNLAKLTDTDCDVVVVDLDDDPGVALDVVEKICTRNSAITVMVYSRSQDPGILVQCMRAGAREFLNEPLAAETLMEALVRAAARRIEITNQKKVSGKVLVFWGAKGGTGVTTLVSNFAIALKQESGAEVALLDLNVQLGDVAVVLGLAPRFTTADALNNADRLDQDFVSTLLTDHKSGVAVLAAPDQYGPLPSVLDGNLRRLLYVMRDKFPYVVVDAGSHLGPGAEVICEMADCVYVVMQAEIPCVRSAQRLISYIGQPGVTERRMELILNRYDPHKVDIDEGRMAKVLPLPLKWKVPNDYGNACRSLNTGVPLAAGNSPIARVLSRMAQEACGKPVDAKKKRWFV